MTRIRFKGSPRSWAVLPNQRYLSSSAEHPSEQR